MDTDKQGFKDANAKRTPIDKQREPLKWSNNRKTKQKQEQMEADILSSE